MKLAQILLIGLMSFVISGCATSRNYEPEINALSSRVDNLQSQVELKNKEIANLSDQIRNLMAQLESANEAKLDAERRLSNALQKQGRKSGSGYDKLATDEYLK
jgi:predicted  nucleic acid-binding Zn-ribbon protein